ncbi:ComF family protein [Glaciimonas sp. GNP009]
MLKALLRWSQQIPALLRDGLPTCCALCGQIGLNVICAGCDQSYFSHETVRCQQCANPLPVISRKTPDLCGLCGDCLKQKRAFDASVVAIDYAAPGDQLVLTLKFGGQLALAPVFARMLRDAALRRPVIANNLPDILTAVPLSPKRIAKRGFNQALEIAKPLSRLLNISLQPNLIQRPHDTLPQAKLALHKRRQNLRNAFTVPPQAVKLISGRHIGVIDDVMTTGETLNELARTLKRFGAVRVTNIVFARTLLK